MARPLFSCVVPAKGARPYLDVALASLQRQGFGDRLEIIVQDGDVEPDGGQSDALNKGFAKAHGDWLFWLNADDILLPGALNRVSNFITTHSKPQTLNSKLQTLNSTSSRPSWIAGNQLLIDDHGNVLKCSVGNGWHDWLYHNAVPHVYGPSSFFKRELFEKVDGFDGSLHYCMDWDLWIRFMKAGARFERIDEYLWAQRQWEGSKTQRKVPPAESAKHWDEIGRMLEKNGLEVTWAGRALNRLWRGMNGNIARQFVDGIRFRGRDCQSL